VPGGIEIFVCLALVAASIAGLDFVRRTFREIVEEERAHGDYPHLSEEMKAPARKARGGGAVNEQRPSGTQHSSLRTGRGAL
jgi:hypothetical protein